MGGDHVWACEDYLCLVVSFVKDYPCSPGDIHIERTKILQRAKHERRAGERAGGGRSGHQPSGEQKKSQP